MSGGTSKDSGNKSGRALDVFVVILCILGVVGSLYLFQRDLFMSYNLQLSPAGLVKVKYNTVQRRHSDRVIWDRLFKESPVYAGDLIRIAKLSGATLDIERNEIDLDEYTLIRIIKNGDSFQIDLLSGNVNINSGVDANILLLSYADVVIETVPGTALSASNVDERMLLKVTEGTASYSINGQIQEIAAPAFFQLDPRVEEPPPMVVVTQPKAGARYLKTGTGTANVNFLWKKFNMRPSALLRLEISQDRNFSANVRTINNLDSSAAIPMNSGVWYWRLSHNDAVFETGRFTVTEAAKPQLLNPEMNGKFRYRTLKPEINFRWTDVEETDSYIVQISDSSNFNNPQIETEVQGTSFLAPELEMGTWYWRVQPVYSNVVQGNSVFSDAAVFHIDHYNALEELELNLPPPDGFVHIGSERSDFSFSWKKLTEAASYTILVSVDEDLSNPVIERTVRDNFFVYGKDENILLPGRYYWSVFFTDIEKYNSPFPQPRSIMTIETDLYQKLDFPPNGYSIEVGQIRNTRFSWRTNLNYERRFQISSSPDFSSLVINVPVSGDSLQGVSLPAGDWYWRISARYDALSPEYTPPARSIKLTAPVVVQPPPPRPAPVRAAPRTPTPPAPARVAAPPPQPRAAAQATPPAQVAPPPPSAQPETPAPPPLAVPAPLRLSLLSPAPGAVLPGLTALREPTTFRWDTPENVAKSRFIISRNANPYTGHTEVEIIDPERTVTVNQLGEGLWYWTIEAYTNDGRPIIAGEPRQLRIQPIPLLDAPENIEPQRGHSIGAEQIKQKREISFNWSQVEGATSYILTIMREADSKRYPIFQSELLEQQDYTFEDLGIFDLNGEYIWQVEAVHVNSEGIIEQRGRLGESNFMMDVPPPRVQTGDTGILYGF